MQQKEMAGVLQHSSYIAAQGTAATDDNWPVWQAPYKCQIVSVTVIPTATISHDGTNYTTYTATRYTAGSTATTVATIDWSTNDGANHTPQAMTLSATAANLILAADDTLEIVKTHAASGLATPDMAVVVRYKAYGV